MLVAAVGLTWALIMAEATFTILQRGVPAAAGNRDETVEATGTHARVKRCSANMLENLPLFAALVLVAHVSGAANATSALGAQIFVGARVVHAALYAMGIPWARTGAWLASIVGMGMIVASLFG